MFIVNEEMPKNCDNCPLYNHEYLACNLTRKHIIDDFQRDENCPLKEVPEDRREELIELIEKYIREMDRKLAVIKVCEASKAKRAYFEGQRLGYVRSQEAIIEKQIKSKKMANLFNEQLEEQSSGKKQNVYLCIHKPTQRIEAICSTIEKAREYIDMQVMQWGAKREDRSIVGRTIDEDYEKELNYITYERELNNGRK